MAIAAAAAAAAAAIVAIVAEIAEVDMGIAVVGAGTGVVEADTATAVAGIVAEGMAIVETAAEGMVGGQWQTPMLRDSGEIVMRLLPPTQGLGAAKLTAVRGSWRRPDARSKTPGAIEPSVEHGIASMAVVLMTGTI